MRTTVTLEPDVRRLLETAMRSQGIPFKQALNDAVRAGLSRSRTARPRRFVQETHRLGPEPYFRWDKALSVAEDIEAEELSRKLALRK